MDIFSSFSEIQKLKMHIFKMFWDTIRCTEKHKDLSEGARVDMGDGGGQGHHGEQRERLGHDRFFLAQL
jgi:hypothetical protein